MLLNRKGFVKVAVEQGLDGGIIPVYHYGNTQVRVSQLWYHKVHVPAAAAIASDLALSTLDLCRSSCLLCN